MPHKKNPALYFRRALAVKLIKLHPAADCGFCTTYQYLFQGSIVAIDFTTDYTA
jgi:hypothetical protein